VIRTWSHLSVETDHQDWVDQTAPYGSVLVFAPVPGINSLAIITSPYGTKTTNKVW
jgi:hypothetical protein